MEHNTQGCERLRTPPNSDGNNIQITRGRSIPPLLSQGKVAVMVRKNAPTPWISRRSEWSWKLVVNGQQEVSGVLFAKSDVRICADVDDGCHEKVQHFCQSLPCSAKNIFRTNFAPERGLTEQEQTAKLPLREQKIKKAKRTIHHKSNRNCTRDKNQIPNPLFNMWM